MSFPLRFVGHAAVYLAAALFASPARAQFKPDDEKPGGVKFDKELVQRIRIAMKVKAVVGNCMGVYGTVPFPMDWLEQKVTVVGEEFSAAGQAATIGLLHSVFGRVECRSDSPRDLDALRPKSLYSKT